MLRFLQNIDVLDSSTTKEELLHEFQNEHPWLIPGKILDKYDEMQKEENPEWEENDIKKSRKAENISALMELAETDLEGVIDAVNAQALERSTKLKITRQIAQVFRFSVDYAHGVAPSDKIKNMLSKIGIGLGIFENQVGN